MEILTTEEYEEMLKDIFSDETLQGEILTEEENCEENPRMANTKLEYQIIEVERKRHGITQRENILSPQINKFLLFYLNNPFYTPFLFIAVSIFSLALDGICSIFMSLMIYCIVVLRHFESSVKVE